MRRRALLGAVGTAATGLAGCLSQSDSETPMSTPLSVSFDALQPGIVSPNSPDSIGVTGDAGQYLSLSVAAEGDTMPATEEFAFVFDGEQYTPLSFDKFYSRPWRLRSGEPDGELLYFGLSESGTASDTTLTWPGGEWTPDPAVRERLAAPLPPLDVSVSVPEIMTSDEPLTVTVTVGNDGSVDGRFVAGLNRVGPRDAYTPVKRFSFRVPAGETVTKRHSERLWGRVSGDRFDDGEPDCTYHLDWHDGRMSERVRATM